MQNGGRGRGNRVGTSGGGCGWSGGREDIGGSAFVISIMRDEWIRGGRKWVGKKISGRRKVSERKASGRRTVSRRVKVSLRRKISVRS
jgi:hypothetical protein